LLLDYIQRIKPSGGHGDRRGEVNAAMASLRQFADAGVAVLVIAAVARSKDKRGCSTYDANALGLASFRESSELEFGADDAFILAPDEKGGGVRLRHLKSRHGETKDLALAFDRRRQRFKPVTPGQAGPPDNDPPQVGPVAGPGGQASAGEVGEGGEPL
jgi:replicative DNA helicase